MFAQAPHVLLAATAALSAFGAGAQDPTKVGAGTAQARDILSPFRAPDQDYPVPDAVFDALRRMETIADNIDSNSSSSSFDKEGRQIIDHPEWQAAYRDLTAARGRGFEGQLARIMRRSRSAADRATAFYGAFFGETPEHVINLISHIPGEPSRPTREKAMARAIPYLRANLGTRVNQLSEDQRQMLIAMRREAGQLGANQGLEAGSFAYGLNIKPFAELLALDDSLDRAQGWWFFKEVVRMRRNDVDVWLRPLVGRIRLAVREGEPLERRQVFELLSFLDPMGRMPPPANAEGERVTEWSSEVIESVFHPIRVVSEGLVELYPGKARDALVEVGMDLLRRGGLGQPARGQLENGDWFGGVKIAARPEPLDQLPIPNGSTLTHVNSKGFSNEAELLEVIETLVKAGNVRLLVEFVERGKPKAVELRIID